MPFAGAQARKNGSRLLLAIALFHFAKAAERVAATAAERVAAGAAIPLVAFAEHAGAARAAVCGSHGAIGRLLLGKGLFELQGFFLGDEAVVVAVPGAELVDGLLRLSPFVESDLAVAVDV